MQLSCQVRGNHLLINVKRGPISRTPTPRPIQLLRILSTLRPRVRTSMALPMQRELLLLSSCSTMRSEEHTSELQSRFDLVCRLLLEKKNELDAQGTLPDAPR